MSLPDSKLFGKVAKGIELVGSIEFLIIFAVATLHLAVVSWSKRLDLFVVDTELCQCLFKHGQRFLFAVSHLVGKLKAIVGLYAFDCIRKFLDNMLEKLCGRVSTLLLERLEIPESAVLVNEGILIVFLSGRFPHQTGARTYFTSIRTR